MTEALPLPPPHAAEQPQADPTVEISIPRQFDTPAALITEETVEDDDGVIACICEFNIDDGNTIQCDQCSRWQHIACYYPPPKKVPDVDQKHYCVDCVPQPELDPRKAADRQRRALDQHNVVKRPATKPSKKKVKDSPSLTAQTNGWSDRHPHIHSHDRKSASPRDQPPPAKKPKILHRSTNSANLGRRRTGTSNAVPTRSPSKSPEMDTSAFIPQYSEGFLHLFKAQDDQIEMSTNLMDNLSLTAQLSDWVTDPDALSKATGGLTPSEVFKRWDASMEDIPGRPEVTLHYVEDTSFQADGITPTWAQLIIEEPITTGTFIGELRGRIGHKDDYIRDGDSRWLLLNHPEPCVFFHPQLPICIDARQEGTRFRYVRRSCQPNAELQTIITEGTEYHFCFMATREIQAGEEVTVAWQVPDLIRDRINSSLRMSNNFQPKTREYISTWVSNVLSNCGPCACNHQNACLMAHYDRRGRTPPSLPAKPVRRKRRAVALEPGTADRSRSASEARKADPEEETSVSRSASGSQVSASRDITPHTHIPGGTSTKVMPELSERERKKLMRTEELFRRQEAESGRQKKKRNSSSNIDTLGANASKNPSLPNGSTSRYIDAGTSSSGRFDSTSRIAGVKRKAGAPPRGPRRDDSQPSRAANYVDASVQCDLSLGQDARDERRRPQRRYISVTQRLLERCVSHTSHAKLPELPTLPSQATTPAFERMDIDQEHKPEMTTNGHPEAQPEAGLSRTGDGDTAMIDADRAPEVKAESPDLQQRPKQEIPVSPSSPNLSDREESHIAQPLAPMESQSTPQEPKDSSSPIPSSTHPTLLDTGPNHRPLMHLEMPPPPSSTTLNAAAAAAFAPMSSQNVLGGPTLSTTPGLLPIAQSPLSLTTPLAMFSPSVTASVLMSPSPVRKKMSLSDYTKRSKAARESGGAGDGPTPVATPAGGASEAAPWSDGGVVASSTIGTVEGEVQGPTSSESVPTLATAAAPAETLADPLSAADDPAATAGDAVKVEAEDDDAGTATALPVAADAPRPPPATPMPTVAAAEDHAKVDGDEPPQPDTVAAGEDPA